jgi:hypothetical protein
MELKVVCDCGQKYKFDVEPVNGQMPFTVNCPTCGVDGTGLANGELARALSSPLPLRVALPPEPAAVATPPAVAAAPPIGGLRLNRSAPPPAVPEAPPALTASAPAPITAVRPVAAATRKPKDAGEEYNLVKGIVGAVLGAVLGAGLMYGFFLLADFRFPLMGTCIGALTGLGARILAKGTDTALGAISGGIALVSTAGTLYFMFGDMAGMFILSMLVSVGFAYKIAS